LAIGLIKARLHQTAGQYEQAEATLADIAGLGQKNAQYTAMLMQTYQHTNQWDKANELLAVARKQSALPIEVLDQIADQAHSSALNGAGESAAAEKLIRATLKNDWSDSLVRLYGSLKNDKPAKLRRTVEGWLMARPENAELNLAAGQFALQEKSLDKAKEYLQKAIRLGQLPKAYSLLGEVYEASNESGKALQLYRSGMLSLAGSDQGRLISDEQTVKGELVPTGKA